MTAAGVPLIILTKLHRVQVMSSMTSCYVTHSNSSHYVYSLLHWLAGLQPNGLWLVTVYTVYRRAQESTGLAEQRKQRPQWWRRADIYFRTVLTCVVLVQVMSCMTSCYATSHGGTYTCHVTATEGQAATYWELHTQSHWYWQYRTVKQLLCVLPCGCYWSLSFTSTRIAHCMFFTACTLQNLDILKPKCAHQRKEQMIVPKCTT